MHALVTKQYEFMLDNYLITLFFENCAQVNEKYVKEVPREVENCHFFLHVLKIFDKNVLDDPPCVLHRTNRSH